MTNILTIRPQDCLWNHLKYTTAPLVLYGTGNGGDKLIDSLLAIGRTPDGVFASDGFVRRREFRGMPVLSLAEAHERFGEEMIVLIAFGSSLPEVMAHMDAIAERYTTYIPELPLFGGELFTYDYYLAHQEVLTETYAMLADEPSRALFTDMLTYRLTGSIAHLRRTQPDIQSYRECFGSLSPRCIVDGGAYSGDSARAMAAAFPTVESILAIEPDPRTYKKLCVWAESDSRIRPYHAALSDTVGCMDFHTSGSRGSGGAGANRRGTDTQVPMITIDALCAHFHPDLIKLDVEGWEAQALSGAVQTLTRDRPALAVSLYHRSRDLFALPLWLKAHVSGEYRWHLRRVPCYPAWDLVLYGVPV